jgi:hypothetical protein
MRIVGVSLALLTLLLHTRAAHAAPPRLFVPDLRAERGIDEGLVRLLGEHMLTEFARSGRLSVIGSSDVKRLIEHERDEYVLGCRDDVCLAEFGGALGADLLAVSSLGRLGDRAYLLNLKLIDVDTMDVLRRWSREVRGGEGDLTDALAEGVDAVSDLSARGVVRREISPWAWVTTGVGGALLITGAVAHGLNVVDHGKLEDMKSADPGRSDLEARVDLEGALAISGYVLGGLATGAGLAWLLWPAPALEDGASEANLRVLPFVSPAGLGITGRW